MRRFEVLGVIVQLMCITPTQNRGRRPNPIPNPKSYPNPDPNPIPNSKPNPKCYRNRVRSFPTVLPTPTMAYTQPCMRRLLCRNKLG